ncbi:MAG: S8 family peptidase [Chloroflexota bacterium]
MMKNKNLTKLVVISMLTAALYFFSGQNLAYTAESQANLSADQSNERGEIIPDQYIVVLESDINRSEYSSDQARTVVANTLRQHSISELNHVYENTILGFAAELDENQIEALEQDPAVEFIEPDQRYSISNDQPNPTWGLDRIDQRGLPQDNNYRYDFDGTGVDIYILDTGVNSSHVEFGGRVIGGYNALLGGIPTDYEDCDGHGTHVAGTAAGSTYGVAKNANIFAVRVLDCSGSGSTSEVIAGIEWVTSNASGPSVANMSLGGGASPALDAAVESSINAGITYALSSGNSNFDACFQSPARVETAITVNSSDSSDNRSSFSNYGTCTDIFAPGSNITSAWYDSDTSLETISGTSMASPHVAGVSALYLEFDNDATPEEVKNSILSLATPNVIADAGPGTPNLLLYSLLDSENLFYLSSTSSGVVGGVGFTDEDIIVYDEALGTWEMFFDGSDVGLAQNPALDTGAFAILNDGSLLFSFPDPTFLNGVGNIDDSDIVRFIPTSTGKVTAGTFEMYLDGSSFGLDDNGEDIDAILIAPDGGLVISTKGVARVPKRFGNQLTALDEDLIQLKKIKEEVVGDLVENISGEFGSEYRQTIQVPANAENLEIEIMGGTGDADLYVGAGYTPTLSLYDCRPYIDGSDEACFFSTVTSETYEVMLYGYNEYADVTLKVSWLVETGWYYDYYFDGSDLGLNDSGTEDVWGASLSGISLYLTALDLFDMNGTSGDKSDIAVCKDVNTGTQSSCASTEIVLDGLNVGIDSERLDAIHVAPSLSSPAPPNSPSWTTIETFDALSDGTINGKNGWSSTGGAKVTADPVDGSNKIMALDEFETRSYKALPDQIADSDTGSLFFRLRRDGAVDGFSGMSDLSTPDQWSAFENQFGSQSQTASLFTIRDGSSFLTSQGGFSDDTWYCVWIISNNSSNSYEVYVQGGQYTSQTQVVSGSSSSFDFRNGGSETLKTFYARTGNNFTGRMLIDDIYVTHNSVNLTQPSSSCS